MNKIILIAIIVFAVLGIIYFIGSRDTVVEPVDITELTETEELTIDEPIESVEPVKEEPKEIISGDNTINGFVQCLADAGMVIYGSRTCPACRQLAESFGGYDAISLIYVECSEEWERCSQEMKTNYVPEIQIKGVLYNGSRDLNALAEKTGCKL